jgi:hypothetical protein
LGDIDEIEALVQFIRLKLPSASMSTDGLMLEKGYEIDDGLFYLWIEVLADITNNFIQQKNEQEVIKHLVFFSLEFEKASEKGKKCIEVSYVENLMWNSASEQKKWAWPLFPENLKHLYASMWGNPDR